MVWINVGLVILAIFMGIITASLSSNSLEQVNNLYGMPVSRCSYSFLSHTNVITDNLLALDPCMMASNNSFRQGRITGVNS